MHQDHIRLGPGENCRRCYRPMHRCTCPPSSIAGELRAIKAAEEAKKKDVKVHPFYCYALHTEPFLHLQAQIQDLRLLTLVRDEFPPPDWPGWYLHEGEGNAKKKASRGVLPGPHTQFLVDSLSTEPFMRQLASWLKIERPLKADPTREGGGLHFIEKGGYLGMHADFNVHPKFGWDRRVNLLLFLNKGWKDGQGGYLELGAEREVSYAPEFGRVVAFPTRDDTIHGHPVPVVRERRSLALYYYTEGRPPEEKSEPHSTLYLGGKL